MRRLTTSLLLALGIGLAGITAAGTAAAHKLDLSLGRFVQCKTPLHCEPQIAMYERFLAEYAFGLSPKLMAPASTLGYSGFYLGVEGTLTPIPGGGTTNDDRWFLGTTPYDESPGVMFVPAIHVRKGLPWSFELGGQINYLAQSEAVALGGDIKWSLFEGYRKGFRGAMPDVAARGSVVRLLGEGDIDMTIVGVDGSISYPFGIGGMISLTPYGGFQYLWTFARIEPLVYRDETPDDSGHEACSGNDPDPTECWATEFDPDGSQNDEFHSTYGPYYDISGLSGPNLERMRLFLGLQLKYEFFSIILEGGWGLATKWDTAIQEPTADSPQYYIDGYNEQRSTRVDHQFQFSGGVGMDF
ncbi:MAG: hypothetical protein R6V85_05170 [Polyangia bacterium]